jgi:hypothetical protein
MSKVIIKELQRDLSELGYYNPPSTVDGIWGDSSQAAWDTMVADLKSLVGDSRVRKEKNLLQRGDQGEHVENLQRELKRVGQDIAIDGVFGPATERAVKSFQKLVGLVVDGVVGDKTLSVLKGYSYPESLTHTAMVHAAKKLDVPVEAIMAVSEVESRGRGFHTNGLPVILFERHVMRRRMVKHGIDPTPYMQRYPEIVNSSPGGYLGGLKEYNRLEEAKKIHIESALESASWGCYQIMGYHWERLGYESVSDFVARMRLDENEHLEAFTRFILADSDLHNALKNQDWASFARIYNGPAYSKNQYDLKMAKAFKRLVEDPVSV